ncbi:MAG TPA: ATP-binding protein [Myxococcales bacterium]|nr:ATP-binding protein [Myxococcales bacterium]
MSQRRFGLRLRLLAILIGAGLLCAAVLAVALLLGARDEITRRHVASARAGLRAVAESIVRRCGADAACTSRAAEAAGLSWREGTPCGAPQRAGERLIVCEEVRGAAVSQEMDLAPAAAQARSLVGPALVLVLLGMLLLAALVFWVLDRQLVEPLARIDSALDRISDAAADGPLLAEGGDLLARLLPAVNRLDLRLREERARVQSQIEELKRNNRELRAAREEVARSERLASVGRLAAGVAHEVGNPMTALLGFLGILRDRLRQGKDPGDYLERLAREAERIDRILRDLLGLARPPARDLQPVDLRAAAERARSLLEAQPSWTGCALELRVPPNLPRARGDDHSVVQVLLNLLVNAAKAGARRVEVEGRAESGSPVVEVIDDGRGLPAEATTRLFEPFFTTATPGEGTGLGLALCHATMERFGGSISARKRAGGTGTSFLLQFAAWG